MRCVLRLPIPAIPVSLLISLSLPRDAISIYVLSYTPYTSGGGTRNTHPQTSTHTHEIADARASAHTNTHTMEDIHARARADARDARDR